MTELFCNVYAIRLKQGFYANMTHLKSYHCSYVTKRQYEFFGLQE